MPPQSRHPTPETAVQDEDSPLRQPSTVGADRLPRFRPVQPVTRRKSFLQAFAAARGPPQIVILIMLLALGFGSTIGVVPAVMADRYARLRHGYDGPDCATVATFNKPDACLAGSADAQNAVAMEQLVSNLLTFFTSSYVGSLSDEHGRRTILLLGVFLSCLSPLLLLLIQLNHEMSPVWYYSVGALHGLVNWIAIALSALSDVMPKKWRAPSFGMLLAGFSFGFALAPQLALALGHINVTILSLTLTATGWLVTYFWFPETVPPAASERARRVRQGQDRQIWWWTLYRPLWELTILNRNRLFRLLSALAFFSGIVSAGDQTLLLYYLEERLDFGDQDVATFFLIMGLLGIFVQSVVLKILNDKIGERYLVMLCFLLGTVHNTMYGLAKEPSFWRSPLAALCPCPFPPSRPSRVTTWMNPNKAGFKGHSTLCPRWPRPWVP